MPNVGSVISSGSGASETGEGTPSTRLDQTGWAMVNPVDSRTLFLTRDRPAHPLVRPMLHFMVVGALAQIVVGVLTGGATTLAVSTFCGIACACALFIARAGREHLGALIALSAVLIGIEYAMYIGQGIHDVATMELSVVLLLAIVVLPQRQAIAFTLVMLATVAGFGVAEQRRWLPNDEVVMNDAADAYLAVVILAALGGLFHYFVFTLARSEQSYAEIFNATHEAIFIHDAQTARILDVNEPMLRMYSYTRRDLADIDAAALSADEPEFSRDHFRERMARAAAGEEQIFEWRARRKDGSVFWAEVTLRRSDIGGQGRVLAVVRDIDARKLAEGRSRQADKLRALGQLAGGIAHDFNNQLAGIAGYAQLLALKPHAFSDVVSHARQVLKATEHAAHLTRQLLAFAREDAGKTQDVDLNTLVADVVEMVRRSIDRAVQVGFEPAPSELVVRVDPAQTHSAILNLCLNARDAMPNCGVLALRTFTLEADDEGARRLADEGAGRSALVDAARVGSYAVVEVVDNGAGMSAAVRERIFEPFFTTKPRGTGMGLATVYGMARGYGGFVEVESEPGAGSRFRLGLPLAEEPSPVSQSQSQSRPSALGLRVLMAEDEPIVAETTRAILEQLGCVVRDCEDGERAVEVFRANSSAFDVALVDLSMPRLSGMDTLVQLRDIDPTVPVVVMSGYTADTSVESLLAAGAAGFVAKPFTVAGLRGALSAALGRSSPPE